MNKSWRGRSPPPAVIYAPGTRPDGPLTGPLTAPDGTRNLAANGWVGINVDYRLSPGVKFPDHLIDLKRAIKWYREHAEEHGETPASCASPVGPRAATSARSSR